MQICIIMDKLIVYLGRSISYIFKIIIKIKLYSDESIDYNPVIMVTIKFAVQYIKANQVLH
jgi:hypothetical protein